MMGRGPMMHGFGLHSAASAICRSRCPCRMASGYRSRPPCPKAARRSRASSCCPWSHGSRHSRRIGMGVRRVTAPLASLSAAAERLGNDLNAPPMPETGTIETRQASHAFNTMQARLRGLIENRTRMLAAISHDLRTPLTLLRLRAESVENAPERDKMLATIAEMDSMIAATLQLVRDEARAEPRRQTDLTALLASAVDDMADAGLPASMEPAESLSMNASRRP